MLRTLVEDIILTPADGRIEIDVRGDLAGILTLLAQKQNPAAGATGLQFEMVSGACFNRNLRHSNFLLTVKRLMETEGHIGLFRSAA
ncbi:hypothetical protein [Sphingomonas sanguinis]|uniref:Uncharacterized protein n=1 Tax=Sphingomonas sanguinis TaxID=33051 RepID=A0A147IRU7_9SPHN|nr:hypothetical protein [Sphingomonas sanguinis]KTT98209.1 hypothetical protein SB4_11675 [Sphingomonas sanguinis]